MYPEDRVLVVYVPTPSDFEILQREHWYRIPVRHAPKGLYAEYYAFYFGRRFGAQKWAIHYYARRLGHELARRRELLPHEPDHPRADELYYKVQLGPLQKLKRPIPSLRWRRIVFLHTTWDRFQDATEINDLFVDGDGYVDRLYATLKEQGIQAERNYRIREQGKEYLIPLMIPCQNGRVTLTHHPATNHTQLQQQLADIMEQIASLGGVLPQNQHKINGKKTKTD